MRYDSTYSALQALNKALGGEDKQPDSEYSAVINLMSTLNGDEVEAANAFEAVETIAVRAVNNELPIQQGGGSCNHILLGNLTCTLNDKWYYASDFGGDGFESVYVNVPTGSGSGDYNVPPIDAMIYSWNTTAKPEYVPAMGRELIKWSCTLNVNPIYDDSHVWVIWDEVANFSGQGWPSTQMSSEKHEEGKLIINRWYNPEDLENKMIYNLREIGVQGSGYHITFQANQQFVIEVEGGTFEPEITSEEWLDYIPDGMISSNYEPLQEGTFEETQGWGNPNDAIPMTLNEFVNAEGYAEDQWFEITGTITGMPQFETGRICIDDDEYSGNYGDREGLFINGFNRFKYNESDGWCNNDTDRWRVWDGDVVTLRTLRHKVDVNGETKICGGKGYNSPLAILVAKNGEPLT